MKPILSNGYSIFTGNDSLSLINDFLKKSTYSQFVILCDENTLTHCLPLVLQEVEQFANAEIIEIESGEASKSLDISTQIWKSLLELKADKKTLFINLGGGVVSDIGGFSASVYKRGIDFINIPTSLLAMADASVGGKTGVDFSGVKNIIGTITQPKAVFVNFVFLNTLPNNHLKNGLAELYKIALISDSIFWHMLSSTSNNTKIEDVITKSILLKNAIVKKDPLENGIRKSLNFGHTIGHAIESMSLTSLKPLLHGEAIVIGMITECWISYHKKLLSKKDLNSISSTLITLFKPSLFKVKSIKPLLELMKNDKKNEKGKIRATLLKGIGSYALDVEISEMQIEKSIEYFNNQVNK